jgi:hypothetical protein
MVFNAMSWETHFASAHTADILELIGERKVAREEFDRALLGSDATPGESAELSKLLTDLEALGLIRAG